MAAGVGSFSNPSAPPRLALALLGDMMLGRHVGEELVRAHRREEDAAAWGDVLPLLVGRPTGHPQMNAGNLETAITTHDVAWPNKTFNFRAAPAGARGALRAARMDFVSLANNHSLDYMAEGLRETAEALDAGGVRHAGAGMDAREAARPALVEREGWRIAFMSYSDHPMEWTAGWGRPGINFIDPTTFRPEDLAAEVAAARDGLDADAVVIFVHWGPNWRWHPSHDLRRLGRAWVDAGAACVFGHSAHHLQGVEVHRGCPIVYGAGAALDDYAHDRGFRNDLGGLFLLELERRGAGGTNAPVVSPVALRMVPLQVEHSWRLFDGPAGIGTDFVSQVNVARGEPGEWALGKVSELSGEMGTRCTRGVLDRDMDGPQWTPVDCLEISLS